MSFNQKAEVFNIQQMPDSIFIVQLACVHDDDENVGDFYQVTYSRRQVHSDAIYELREKYKSPAEWKRQNIELTEEEREIIHKKIMDYVDKVLAEE